MEARKKKLNKTDWATASSSPDCTYFSDPSFSSTKEVSCVIHAIGMKCSLYVKEEKDPFSHTLRYCEDYYTAVSTAFHQQ